MVANVKELFFHKTKLLQNQCKSLDLPQSPIKTPKSAIETPKMVQNM
jgi:hypothetical protein